MTQTFKTGSGYTVQEIGKYISLNNKSLKDKIIQRLLQTDSKL